MLWRLVECADGSGVVKKQKGQRVEIGTGLGINWGEGWRLVERDNGRRHQGSAAIVPAAKTQVASTEGQVT